MPDTHRRKLLLAAAAIGASSLHRRAFSADSSVAEVRRRGVLHVGTEAAYEPYEFLQDGKIVGYGRDILQLVVDRLGVALVQVNLPFQGLLPGLLAQKFDIVATSVGINPERVRRFAYTRPIGGVETQLVTRASDSAIHSVDDLRNKIVGTQMGSSIQPQARAIDQDLIKRFGRGFTDTKLFQSVADVGAALTNVQIDAALMPSNMATVLMRAQPHTLQVVATLTGIRYVCWVTRPSDADLRDFVNGTITEGIANGKIATLQEKWFGSTLNLPASGYLPPGAV